MYFLYSFLLSCKTIFASFHLIWWEGRIAQTGRRGAAEGRTEEPASLTYHRAHRRGVARADWEGRNCDGRNTSYHFGNARTCHYYLQQRCLTRPRVPQRHLIAPVAHAGAATTLGTLVPRIGDTFVGRRFARHLPAGITFLPTGWRPVRALHGSTATSFLPYRSAALVAYHREPAATYQALRRGESGRPCR